jgi:hypothetical protein
VLSSVQLFPGTAGVRHKINPPNTIVLPINLVLRGSLDEKELSFKLNPVFAVL